MCGIIGFLGKNSQKYVTQALPKMALRGPDNQGILSIKENLTFGASRLAMTDPHPRSNQPMQNKENGDVIVFNGEIYNFPELKVRLIKLGIKFNTESDTEVLLKSLGIFGIEILPDLEGMFSFVYYSKKHNSMYLARDYLGKKPLYFYLKNDRFYFASQINLIKDWIGSVEINSESLVNYLSLGYVIDPQTMYTDILSVAPGTVKILDLKLIKFTKELNFIPKSIRQPIEKPVRELLGSSVLERTAGHSNFAISLSGGVDSTVIALLASDYGLKFNAFTMRWLDSDKRRYNYDFESAALIAKKLGISFHSVDGPHYREIPDLLLKFVSRMEEPNSNPTGLSMLNLYSQISQAGIRLALTGDGSDEIFGGYERYSHMKKISFSPNLESKLIQKMVLNYRDKFKLLSKIGLSMTPPNSIISWLYWQQISNRKNLIKDCDMTSLQNFEIDIGDLSKIFFTKDNLVALNMFRDLKTWLVMESNRKLDRVSMAFSVEARSPFQSEKVIGAAYRLMAKDDFKKLGKSNLLDSFPELSTLPINNRKMGFMSPVGHWLRNNPNMIFDSINYLKHNLNFDGKLLDQLAISPQQKKYSDFSVLWNLVVLSNWHSINFKK
jgi:asparagine synthase (glutamine-hydrolysing)